MTINKPRILFVDDDANILKALARLLHGRRETWDMDFVNSGQVALQKTSSCSFDVVITDLAMPSMTGLELVQTLNKTAPQTRCIILTGTADLQMAAEIINTVRVFRFYTKPCPTDVLIEGIMAGLADATLSLKKGQGPEDDPGNVVLDRLSTGVFVISGKGEVVYMNQSAAETIANADGLLIGQDQILRASTNEETNNLRQACEKLDKASNEDDVVALSIGRPSMGEALKLILVPLDNPDEIPEGHVIVFVTDPDKKAFPSTEMIARFFKLTPTESRLAWELIRGQRTEEIAEAMGITISSARTYLKRVMEKTSTNRQVDLVRLLLSTPQLLSGTRL